MSNLSKHCGKMTCMEFDGKCINNAFHGCQGQYTHLKFYIHIFDMYQFLGHMSIKFCPEKQREVEKYVHLYIYNKLAHFISP